MEVYGDTRTESERNIRHSDKARASYYQDISVLKWGEKEHYDLVIDFSAGIENSADQIVCHVEEYNTVVESVHTSEG